MTSDLEIPGVAQIQLDGPEVRDLLSVDGRRVAILGEWVRKQLQSEGVVVVRGAAFHSRAAAQRLFQLLADTIGPATRDIDGTTTQEIRLRDTPVANLTLRRLSLADRPYQEMPLHSDGAFCLTPADWVGLIKTEEEWAQGGETILLRLADWPESKYFLSLAHAHTPVDWSPPTARRSLGSAPVVHAPVFTIEDQFLFIRFARHCVNTHFLNHQPALAEYLDDIERSLMSADRLIEIRLETGDMYFINNRNVLHGRRAFRPHPHLKRSVTRVSGRFPSSNH